MKVYTKVVIDIRTGAVKASKSFEYGGDTMLCKGGPSSTTTTATTTGEIDYVYNDRMATIAERQQGMAEEYLDFWRSDYQPMERAQIQANIGLIPEQAEHEAERLQTERMQFEAQRELQPAQTELQRGIIQAGQEEVASARPVMSEYYKEALKGADPEARVREARADVAGAFKEQEGSMRREMGRMGIDPSSERYAGLSQRRKMEQAKATAGAMTGARRGAEEEKFARLGSAAQTFKGGMGGY